jgi:hypothetical protein
MAQAQPDALRPLNRRMGARRTMQADTTNLHMSAIHAPVVLALLVATCMLASSAIAETPCAGVPIAVQGGNADESEIACDGARAAFAFFAPLELRRAPALTIELIAALPPDSPSDAVGAYVIPSRRILVLRYESFIGYRGWFGLVADKRLYRALIAHEVAHAIASSHAGEARLNFVAQEYLAYVAMIATMPENHRRELLALHPGTGFDDPKQINEFVYGFSPGHFAVESYRHWRRQPDPAAFLRRVLDGREIEGLSGP